jgi:CNT family concentrative nucleoside transporter
MEQIVSFAGTFGLIALAWLMSSARRAVRIKTVLSALALQFLMAACVLNLPAGRTALSWVNESIVRILDYAREGIYFTFGPLAVPPGQTGASGETSPGFILAIQGLPTVIFFSALVSALYYVGFMPLLLRLFSRVFTRAMGISGAEALATSSQIFVGIESVFSVRPYLQRMTISELHLVLVGGMATIASSVLGLYVLLLRESFPGIAGHLVSASLMSAPAAVIMAKVLVPETGQPETLGRVVEGEKPPGSSLAESIIIGATEGMKLTIGIVTMLIAFVGLVAMANGFVGWAGASLSHVGVPGAAITIQGILAAVFYPFTLLIGVDPRDAWHVASVLGERTVLTEVAAYQHLAALIRDDALASPRSAVLAAYGLCGFSHVAGMAIFVGGLMALVPDRTAELARLSWRALLAATLACLQTAAVTGVFIGRAGAEILGR